MAASGSGAYDEKLTRSELGFIFVLPIICKAGKMESGWKGDEENAVHTHTGCHSRWHWKVSWS